MKSLIFKGLIFIFLFSSLALATNGGSRRKPKPCDDTNLNPKEVNTTDLFVGALLPQNVREYYANLQNQIKERGINMTNTLPNKLHVTIKFIGRVNNEEKEKTLNLIKEYLKDVKINQITFRPDGLIFLGNLLAARLQSDQLKALWQLLDEKLETMCTRDKRAYLAHITLGVLNKGQESNKKISQESVRDLHHDDIQLTIENVDLLGNSLNGAQQYSAPNDYEMLFRFPQ